MNKITKIYQKGATMVEYAALVALISCASMIALHAVGINVGKVFTTASTTLSATPTPPPTPCPTSKTCRK